MRRTLRVVLLLILTGVIWNLPMPAAAQKQPVRHVVVFKYKKGAPEAQIAQVTRAFRDLRTRIPGITGSRTASTTARKGRTSASRTSTC